MITNMSNDYNINMEKFLIESIKKLKSSDRRKILAKIVKEIGRGGQTLVSKVFKIGKDTLRKGRIEIESGVDIKEGFNKRGRKKAEEMLPNLLNDIKEVIDEDSQTDPSFKTTRLYVAIRVKEVRRRLITLKHYKEEELPSNTTLNKKLNMLGYTLKKVKKAKPLKKIKETDDIFKNQKEFHEKIKDKENIVRISIDTKDKVKIGSFSRGGYNRIETNANDHDFCNKHVTPFGILDVKTKELEFIFTESKVTADFMVDKIEEFWLRKDYVKDKDILVINMDNGPENNSRRSQFIKRILEFSIKYNITIFLSYYPPYHSKYNPIERAWGALENYWNGQLLDSIEAVLGYASNMTYCGYKPNVVLDTKVYKTGVKVKKSTMEIYENALERLCGIEKWFVKIDIEKAKKISS